MCRAFAVQRVPMGCHVVGSKTHGTAAATWRASSWDRRKRATKIYARQQVWYSTDDGTTWQADAASLPLNITVALRRCGELKRKNYRLHCNSNIVYIISNANIWRAIYRGCSGGAARGELPSPPMVRGHNA